MKRSRPLSDDVTEWPDINRKTATQSSYLFADGRSTTDLEARREVIEKDLLESR